MKKEPTTKMELIYVYDALCGWCYGFSPVMTNFREKYSDSLNFNVISGGMITGGRIGPIGEVASYISWAYKDVEKSTGVKFGDEFLNQTLKDGSAIFTSIPPSVALSVFKEMKPEQSVEFSAALQRAIYYDGIEPENLNVYGKIAETFGLDSADFIDKMEEPGALRKAEADFEFSSRLGVTGFPSVFIKSNEKYYKIGSGYCSLPDLESNYLKLKESLK